MSFNYSSEDAKRKAEELKALLSQNNKGSNYSNDNKYRWFNFPPETTKVTLRILPFLHDGGYMMVYRHNELPGKKPGALCLQTHGMNCPICEVLQKYKGRQDLKKQEAGVKVYVNGLFIRATDNNNNIITLLNKQKQPFVTKTTYLVPLGLGIFQWLVESMTDPEKGDVMHPETGRNVTLERESYNGKFKKEFSFNTGPIADTKEEIQAILSSMVSPKEIWRTPDDAFYKELKEQAAELDVALEAKQRELMSGMGGMPTHPRANPMPNQAQQLGNPAFSQPAMPNPSNPGYAPPYTPTLPSGTMSYTPPVTQPSPAPQMAPSYQPTPAPSPSPAVPAPAAANPAGSPACFGDPAVFNRTSNKCMICNFDYHCERKINAARTAT